MLKHLSEYCKYVEITGFSGLKIKNEKDFVIMLRNAVPKTVEVQFFDACLVATWQHLYFAVLNSLMAFRNKRNISKSVAVEVMLYASAEGQINKAINQMGVKKSSCNVAAVIISTDMNSVKMGLLAVKKCLGVEPDDSVLDLTQAKTQRIKRAFNISETELSILAKDDSMQALVDLVVENVALLSTQL